MYQYKIFSIKKIYDGDTITAVIDLGFGVYKTAILRLKGIDAPELRGDERPEGIKSRVGLGMKSTQQLLIKKISL